MKPGGMGDLSNETARETDEALRDQELRLLIETTVDWDRLRPHIADQIAYDAFIKVVEASTAQNDSVAQLKARIQVLGREGFGVARKVLDLINRV
jgi:hypothetical protein